jgi:hypothetical protein
VNEPDLFAGQQTSPQPEPATAINRPPLTALQKKLLGVVAGAALTIAIIGFAGSYTAVTHLAEQKHFGWFAYAFPAGIDAGIVAFLALDLVLTWLRMPYPLLRQGAWGLTAATIAFNAAAAWGDNLAVAMHAVIPVLFVVVVEAARHAIGRIAAIVADRHIESPPWQRWILSPIGTFLIWRRQRVWQIPSYLKVIEQQRELRVFRAQLRKDYGFWWWRTAPADKLLVFELARFGISVSEALAMPEAEAEAQRQAEAAQKAEARRQAEVEAEALRVEESKRRAETEARRLAEAETEAKLAALARARRIAEAETEAELAAHEQQRLNTEAEAEASRRRIAEQQRQAEAEADLLRQQQASVARQQAAEAELKRMREAEEMARRASTSEAEALRLAQQRLRVHEDAIRKESERRAAEAETLSVRPAAKPKPETEATSPKRPAEIGSRRARIDAEVETLLGLMRIEGYDAIDLKRVERDLNLKQTTAWDRLLKAQAKWKSEVEAEAS